MTSGQDRRNYLALCSWLGVHVSVLLFCAALGMTRHFSGWWWNLLWPACVAVYLWSVWLRPHPV